MKFPQCVFVQYHKIYYYISMSSDPASPSRHREKRDRSANPPTTRTSSDNNNNDDAVEESNDSNFESDVLTNDSERPQEGPIADTVNSPTKELLLDNQDRSQKLREYESELEGLQKEANDAQAQAEMDNNLEINKTFREKFDGCYNYCWDSYPRCCAITLRVIIPLLALIFCAFIGGWALAGFEAPDEYSVNDDIMAARKVVEFG